MSAESCRVKLSSLHSRTVSKTVVVVGDVGAGKSTIVEKMTGAEGLSSDASASFTTSPGAFLTPCRRLQVVDTPGSNAMRDNLQHNVCIANALTFAPVSLILIVVKAEVRIDATLDCVRRYAESFVELSHLLCVIVTHMDTIDGWNAEESSAALQDEFDIDSAFCVGLATSGCDIVESVTKMCKEEAVELANRRELWQLFRISDRTFKILKKVKEEVDAIKLLAKFPLQQLTKQSEYEWAEVVARFRSQMSEKVQEAKLRVQDANEFTFTGANQALERGHIANLERQLQSVIEEVIEKTEECLTLDPVKDIRMNANQLTFSSHFKHFGVWILQNHTLLNGVWPVYLCFVTVALASWAYVQFVSQRPNAKDYEQICNQFGKASSDMEGGQTISRNENGDWNSSTESAKTHTKHSSDWNAGHIIEYLGGLSSVSALEENPEGVQHCCFKQNSSCIAGDSGVLTVISTGCNDVHSVVNPVSSSNVQTPEKQLEPEQHDISNKENYARTGVYKGHVDSPITESSDDASEFERKAKSADDNGLTNNHEQTALVCSKSQFSVPSDSFGHKLAAAQQSATNVAECHQNISATASCEADVRERFCRAIFDFVVEMRF